MTTTTDPGAAHRAARTPTYDGPGAEELRRRLRGMQSFCEFASSAVGAGDVERAKEQASRALVELTDIIDALGLATPAEVLDWQAEDARRNSPAGWQPDPTRGGEPLVDIAQADPVLVSANDLVDVFRAGFSTGLGGAFPDGLGRAAVHIARQQPHRLVDFWGAAGHRWQEVQAAVRLADALPSPISGDTT